MCSEAITRLIVVVMLVILFLLLFLVLVKRNRLIGTSRNTEDPAKGKVM